MGLKGRDNLGQLSIRLPTFLLVTVYSTALGLFARVIFLLQNFPGFGFADAGFQMSFGIGAFPFGFFASTFTNGNNLNTGRPPARK